MDRADSPSPHDNLKTKITSALADVYRVCHGSFACVAMVDSSVIVGFRDPYGIKPLILGLRRHENGSADYMLASESIALEKLDFEIIRDVLPGEAVFISCSTTLKRKIEYRQIVPPRAYCPDVFELIYFALPGSTIDGIDVHECRKNLGVALAEAAIDQIGAERCHEIDVVIPVPESGYVAGMACASRLGVAPALGLAKNRYSTRSFITPGQGKRRKAVWRKLSAVRSEFEGKTVLLVDDSIVRGSTSCEIVKMARQAGAKRVIFASTSPAIRYNHIYGIDLDDPRALIAHGRKETEVAEVIGADAVVYLPLESMIRCCLAARSPVSQVDDFEVGLFTGRYIGGPVEIRNGKRCRGE